MVSKFNLEYACGIAILSLIHRIDAHILPAGSSCSNEDLGRMKTWRDDTWYTLRGSSIGSGELERKGDIKLALLDFSFRSDVDAGVRFVVIYETRWRKEGDEDWAFKVRWKRAFMTKEEAYEGYWWGAQQGWSIPFFYTEALTQELDMEDAANARLSQVAGSA